MRRQPCKLMRDDNTTGIANRLHWGEGVNNRIFKYGYELRTNQVIHFYDHPLQATFFSPIHVTDYTKLREVTHYSKMVSDGTKCAAKSVTTGKEIPIPEITIEQRVEIAIRCALKVHPEPEFVAWANKWLSGEDRFQNTTATSPVPYAPAIGYTIYAAAAYTSATAFGVSAAYAVEAAHAVVLHATEAVYTACTIAIRRGIKFNVLDIIADVVGWKE